MPLIDWFTVVAQVINFLILVWLLRHFLYKPILNAIDAREKRIADELANAKAKKAEAEKEKEEFKHKNEEFDQQRNVLLNKTKDEAKAERQRLLEEVRKEVSDLRAKQQEALKNEEQNLRQEIRRRTQQEVFSIARKVLTDLAGTSLEERTVDIFAQRLHDLSEEEKKQLASALSESSSQVLVRSAFDLPQTQRDSLKKTIKETLGTEIQPKFETFPELISGIELTTDGQKIAWSIADYLASLQKSIDELLKEPASKAKPEPEHRENEPKSKREPEVEQKPDAKQQSGAKRQPETTSKFVADVPKSKTESEVETKPETDYHKPKSRKEPETEQEKGSEQEAEVKQESGTKSESLAKQETNSKTKAHIKSQ